LNGRQIRGEDDHPVAKPVLIGRPAHRLGQPIGGYAGDGDAAEPYEIYGPLQSGLGIAEVGPQSDGASGTHDKPAWKWSPTGLNPGRGRGL
jgi:hypothetical protein